MNGIDQDGIDMLHEDVKRYREERDMLASRTETLTTLLVDILNNVEPEGDGVYITRPGGGKHYMPDRLATALLRAMDYVYPGVLSHDKQNPDQH